MACGPHRVRRGGGELALVFYRQGRVCYADTVQITDGLITAYGRVTNPDKLAHL
jgi:RNA polymerase sigma-70 factor, ECF subfamily